MTYLQASRLVVCMTGLALMVGGPPLAWSQTIYEDYKLVARDGSASDEFGNHVAISGNVAAVGVPNDDTAGIDAGAVYVYQFDGTSWLEAAKLIASDARAGDQFGDYLDLQGDVILIGAPSDDDRGDASGSAWVYRYDGSAWMPEQKLTASDGSAGDLFGRSVAISQDVAVVGATNDDDNGSQSGAAYVFRNQSGNWLQEQKLLAFDGTEFDQFGGSVAVDENIAIVGANWDSDLGNFSGSAYMFRFDGSRWNAETKLLASNGGAGDGFGYRVAIDNGIAVIGAPNNAALSFQAGAAYIFEYDGDQWTERAWLTASDYQTYDRFGRDVSIAGDTIAIGAPGRSDIPDRTGKAYIFKMTDGQWVEQNILLSSDGANGDLLGESIATDGISVLVGSILNDSNGTHAGAAYVFAVPPPGVLTLSDPVPGVAHRINRWTCSNGVPGELVYFVYGFQSGARNVPGCQGLTVDIQDPILFGRVRVNQNRQAILAQFVPGHASGHTFLFQAIEQATCRVSPALDWPFP